MRDPQRIDRIIELIRGIWKTYPDLRLTQLIMNTLNMTKDPYYVEDDILEKKLREYQDLLSKK